MAAKKKAITDGITVENAEATMTGFDSHGQRYFRVTVPREFGELFDSRHNVWNVEVGANGELIYTPLRELIRNAEPRKAKEKATA